MYGRISYFHEVRYFSPMTRAGKFVSIRNRNERKSKIYSFFYLKSIFTFISLCYPHQSILICSKTKWGLKMLSGTKIRTMNSDPALHGSLGQVSLLDIKKFKMKNPSIIMTGRKRKSISGNVEPSVCQENSENCFSYP